jgi:polar amino acid transport system substrate-binding protein
MKRSLYLSFVLAICVMGYARTAAAADLELCAGDIPPFAHQQGKVGQGVVYEIVSQLATRLGQRSTITFLPWKRCQELAQAKKNVAIFPLARTPEREKKYTWILEVLQDPFVLYKVKGNAADISTIQAAQNLNVGALLGSPAESLLRSKGFKRIDLVPTEEQNLKKLMSGRIDAWLVASMVAASIVKKAETTGDLKKPIEIERGVELEVLRQHLAGNPDIDAATVTKWQEAFEAMKRDGTYERIMANYPRR